MKGGINSLEYLPVYSSGTKLCYCKSKAEGKSCWIASVCIVFRGLHLCYYVSRSSDLNGSYEFLVCVCVSAYVCLYVCVYLKVGGTIYFFT